MLFLTAQVFRLWKRWIGTGTLDWKTILPAAKQGSAKWFILEHD
ncbi:hypothetical protein O8B93_24715 [Agrobacterium rhizogenes]|nr:hypothetical protein [Rhizobium rhizogenes]MCZ7450790.1 hypothetical protein [Rhizobium rhizogenes]